MKTTIQTSSLLTVVFAVCAAFLLRSPVHAATLTFSNASARSAAAAMNQHYGVTVVFRGSIDTSRPVSFSVDSPDTPGGRLQAVSNLASALGLDFQKVFVVSKAAPGASVPEVKLDSDGPIVFTSTHVSAREAIQTVAAVDSAVTQISGLVTGNVLLPRTHLTASEAAAIIAKQTGTQWKAYYGLFRRGEEPQRLSGAIIDRTGGGQPIMELPLLNYRSTISRAVPLNDAAGAVVGPFAPLSTSPDVSSVANTNFGLAPDDGLYGYGYGDPYGYTNPYGPYGYAAPNGAFAAPGVVVTPGVGATPVVPGVNAPGVNAVAGANGTAMPVGN